MEIFRLIKELEPWIASRKAEGRTTGFVPTMGALHDGHVSLVKRSVEENDLTVCSVFVNPIQFNNPEDLLNYPRTPEKDIEILAAAGCNMVFMPENDEMYPDTVRKKFSFGHLDSIMEGSFRPGHFNGVAIVVDRLFSLIKPDKAYFGLKDYQQLLVIREMVRQTGHKVNIIGCQIVREPDGLAMSSRNIRLTPENKANAHIIYEALKFAAENFNNYPVKTLENMVKEKLGSIPDSVVEYATISDAETLVPFEKRVPGKSAVMCVAIFLGGIRLIDNIILD